MAAEQRAGNLSTTALYIGVPVLIGASCYYLYYVNRNKEQTSDDNKRKAKQLSPQEQMAQFKQVGNHNFSRKNYDIAIEHYTKAIDFSQTLTQDVIKPIELAIFYQNRAACNEALSDFEKVVVDCDSALKLNKNYVKAYIRRAKAYEKLKKLDKAMVDAFSANLLEKFQNQSIMTLTENIVKASSQEKAVEAMKNHKPTWPAVQIIKAYFSAFTQDPVKDILKSINKNSTEKLQSILDEAMKPEKDNDPVSLLIRGSCLSIMNDLKAAQEAFDKLLKLDDAECSPRIKANALIKKAAIVISEPSTTSFSIHKDLERVHELLSKAAEIDPENPDIYLHKSQALALSERLEDAVEALNKAIALKEDFFSAIAQRFYIEFKLATRDTGSTNVGKLQDLLEQFKRAVKENPESLDLHQMYAQVLTEMNLFELADQVLVDLAKLDPNDGNVYVSRALLQFHMKNDPDEVTNLMQEALKIDPKIMFAYEILGSIESQRGKVDEAVKVFETALKYAQSEAEYARCYSMLDSAISQRAAAELLEMQM